MTISSITNQDIFKVLDEGTHKTFYGCNQEWYTTEWKRRSGCAPSAASNIIFYLYHTRSISGLEQNVTSKENCLSLMKEVWEYVLPTKEGITSTKMFYEDVLSYTKSKGLNVEYDFLDLPNRNCSRPKLSEVLEFLKGALISDAPIAFLNLSSGKVKNLQRWHWVTIISLECTDDDKSASIKILDEGLIKKINFTLWYNTTTLGGGFVYFMSSNV